MKKLLIASTVVCAIIAGVCSKCKKPGCQPGDTSRNCDRCYTEFDKYIGARLWDPRVQAGEEVTFEDGTIIRSVPKEKITPWENPNAKPAAEAAAAPAAKAAKPAEVKKEEKKPEAKKEEAKPAEVKKEEEKK